MVLWDLLLMWAGLADPTGPWPLPSAGQVTRGWLFVLVSRLVWKFFHTLSSERWSIILLPLDIGQM